MQRQRQTTKEIEIRHNLGFHLPARVVAQEPSIEEMDRLENGEYIALDNGTICVRCDRVDDTQLSYVCPSCWSIRRRDGKPSARAQRTVHSHGNGGGDLRVRGGEHRVMHCTDTEFRWGAHLHDQIEHGVKHCYPGGVILYVTPSTKGARLQ